MNAPTLTLEESKNLILWALYGFDANLGDAAKKIFNAGFDHAAQNSDHPDFAVYWKDKDVYFKDQRIRDLDIQNLNDLEYGVRWRIAKVAPDKVFIMRSIPAESMDNNHPYSVIDYHFDGTINSVIYMAHEVGHSIADDYIRAAGYRPNSATEDLDETQAYFIQKIVTDHLGRSSDPAIAQSARAHVEVSQEHSSRGIYLSYASDLYDFARKQDRQSREDIMELLLGRQGPKNFYEILEQTGILKPDDQLAPQRDQLPEAPVLASKIPQL